MKLPNQQVRPCPVCTQGVPTIAQNDDGWFRIECLKCGWYTIWSLTRYWATVAWNISVYGYKNTPIDLPVAEMIEGEPQFAESKTADSMPSDEKIWLDAYLLGVEKQISQPFIARFGSKWPEDSETTVAEDLVEDGAIFANTFMAELERHRAQRAAPDDRTTAETPPS